MADRERPMSWEDWKWLHRWPRLTSIEWALEWLVYWCKGLAVFEVLEFAGRASVLVALILWFWEADDRKKQSHYRAWELINSARGLTSDGGRRDALQDLNKDGVNLSAAPLAKAYLAKVQLPNADLFDADLSGANLNEANLSKAKLLDADLSGADLDKADLSEAILGNANLSGASLANANLSGVILLRANLSNADLSGADLSGADLSGAILANANLTSAYLIDANLSEAILYGTNLTGATVSVRNIFLKWLGEKSSEAELEAELAFLLGKAKLCETTMPDGTLNNRDCPPKPASPNPSETPPVPN